MPPKRASWHWTRYPVSATNKPKLSGQSEDGQINYRASHVIDVFPADQMIFIWADSRVEARSLKNWDILWRTNRINSPISINTGSHRFSSVGNILREVPRTRVFRSLNRAVVVHGNRLQGVHLTHGTLRWEIKIAADQPYGYSTQKTQPRGITRPPLMLRVAVTLDRVYTLSPGGTVSAFRSQDRELLWQMKIDQMRSGRIYVTQGKVLVLAAVGRKEDKKYQLWRWDEISGKLESNKPLDQPLVHLTNKLGPNGILYLASERTLRGYDPIKGIVVWEVHRDPIQEVFALTGDKVLLATGSRFDVLAGDSGRRVMSGTLGSRRVVQAKVAGSNLYLLTVPSLSRRTPQVSPWIGAFDIKRKKLLWRTSQFANLYYPYYFDLQPMTNGGVVFSSYSVNSSYNRTQIFAEGKLQSSLPTSTKRVSTRSTTRPQLHRCFAYGGYLFIPVQNGLQTYRSTK